MFINRLEIAENLFIRKTSLDDAVPLYNVIERNRQGFMNTMSWVTGVQSSKDVENFIHYMLEASKKDTEHNYVILVENEVSGNITYRMKPNRVIELGYWLDKKHQNNNIITKCVTSLTKMLLENEIGEKVRICCSTDNIASNRVAVKSNFQYKEMLKEKELINGELHDQNIYEKTS